MGVWGFRLATLAALGVLLYFVPLIHVTKITADDTAKSFDAARFAETFWTEQLIPATNDAASATQVVADLAADPALAGERHGRRVGVSRGFLLFVQGVGAVEASDDRGVTMKLDGGGVVRLSKRRIFGSTIRDATGLLTGDEAPDSRSYNEVATELNDIAAKQAITKLAGVEPGERLRFAACAKVVSPASYKPPLEVIPVSIGSAE